MQKVSIYLSDEVIDILDWLKGDKSMTKGEFLTAIIESAMKDKKQEMIPEKELIKWV